MGIDDHDLPPYFHRKNRYDLNSKIMLTAIVSLSIVVFFVTVIHIYARCVLRRRARRRAALRHLTMVVTGSASQTQIGLDPSVMGSIPVFVFKQSDHYQASSIIECSICLSVLGDGESVRSLPNCKHIFHAECIDKWFGSHTTCPICRTEAEPRLVPEPREGMVGRDPPSASAPPLEGVNTSIAINVEGTSSSSSAKIVSGSNSRLSSFRRILSREISSRRLQVQSRGVDDGTGDLERQ